MAFGLLIVEDSPVSWELVASKYYGIRLARKPLSVAFKHIQGQKRNDNQSEKPSPE